MLGDLDGFFAATLRRGTTVERFGSMTLYLRAAERRCTVHPSGEPLDAADVAAALDRQRELGLPEKVIWIAELAPGLAPIVTRRGLPVTAVPQMVHTGAVPAETGDTGAEVRLLRAGDADLGPMLLTAQHIVLPAFGELPPGEVLESIVDSRAAELGAGLRFEAVGALAGRVLSAGSATREGDVAEITGVATEPAARGNGLATAVTTALLHALYAAGARTVFLSAGDDRVARLYGRLGFTTVGTFCLARREVQRGR